MLNIHIDAQGCVAWQIWDKTNTFKKREWLIDGVAEEMDFLEGAANGFTKECKWLVLA